MYVLGQHAHSINMRSATRFEYRVHMGSTLLIGLRYQRWSATGSRSPLHTRGGALGIIERTECTRALHPGVESRFAQGA